MRIRRLVIAGLGGALGFVIGISINGRGWLAVGVLAIVAVISAGLSAISAVWSSTGLWLLVGTALATGPFGMIKPWWLTPLWVLAGVGWWIALHAARLDSASSGTRTAIRRRRVLRRWGRTSVLTRTTKAGPSRQGLAAALNVAYADVFSQRAAESGASTHIQRLVKLLGLGPPHRRHACSTSLSE